METLPVEVVCMIANHLSLKDISACCAVSRYWRYIFGSDEIWRRYCDPEIEEHLRTTPCVVEPVFTLADAQDSTLDPVCGWRAAFLRQKHLWANWQQGKCRESNIEININPLTFFVTNKLLFVTNNYLACIFTNSVKLWDVRAFPPKEVASAVLHPEFLGCWAEYDEISSLIVIAEFNFITVLKVNLSEASITPYHMFHFDESTKLTDSFCLNPNECEPCKVLEYKATRKLDIHRAMMYATAGTTFLGYCSVDERNCIHLWNADSGLKIKEEPCPLSDGFQIINISKSVSCEDVLVMLSNKFLGNQRVDFYFFIYDVPQLKFLPFKESVLNVLNSRYHFLSGALVGDYVVVASYDSDEPVPVIRIFDYRNSDEKCMFRVPSEAISLPFSVCHIGNGFLLHNSLVIVAVFPKVGMIGQEHYGMERFECNGCNLVLIRLDNIWVDKRFMSFISQLRGLVKANKACTRTVEYEGNRIKISYLW